MDKEEWSGKDILGRGTAGARALQQAHAGHVEGRENAGEQKHRERAGRWWACGGHTLGVWRAEDGKWKQHERAGKW